MVKVTPKGALVALLAIGAAIHPASAVIGLVAVLAHELVVKYLTDKSQALSAQQAAEIITLKSDMQQIKKIENLKTAFSPNR